MQQTPLSPAQNRPKLLILLLFASLCLIPVRAWSWYPGPGENAGLKGNGPIPLVGQNQYYFVGKGDTLIQLARAMGLGYDALHNANPDVDPWLPRFGQRLLLPYSAIFPTRPIAGITVNLAELRLYLLWQQDGLFHMRIYPVGIGDQGTATPEGKFRILQKIVHPSWTAPASIREKDPQVPPLIPPGPDNPLGNYWMEFTPQGDGIHGTNHPYGVGRRVSHGCIRLYPEDIRNLFGLVKLGTPVHVLYKPIKVGIRNDTLYVEAHPDFLHRIKHPFREVVRQAAALGWTAKIDRQKVARVVKEARGIPRPVSEEVRPESTGPGQMATVE